MTVSDLAAQDEAINAVCRIKNFKEILSAAFPLLTEYEVQDVVANFLALFPSSTTDDIRRVFRIAEKITCANLRDCTIALRHYRAMDDQVHRVLRPDDEIKIDVKSVARNLLKKMGKE